MSEAAAQLESVPGPQRAGPVSSQLSSKLIAPLFRNVDSRRRLTVLEVGTALPETVDFLAQFKCRLHFVDLYNEPFVLGQQDLSEAELRKSFESQFRFSAGTALDLCLFWDFLCYLDDPALRALNAALRPWLQPSTRAHGFGAHHLAIHLENVQYGIQDAETLTVRQRRGTQMRTHPHSQLEMNEMLSCLRFERGLLLADGKLEMLLSSRA